MDPELEHKRLIQYTTEIYDLRSKLEAVCALIEDLREASGLHFPEGASTQERFAMHYCRHMDERLAKLEDANPGYAALVQRVLSDGEL